MVKLKPQTFVVTHTTSCFCIRFRNSSVHIFTISLQSFIDVLRALAQATKVLWTRLDVVVRTFQGVIPICTLRWHLPLPAGNFHPRLSPSGALSCQVFGFFDIPHFGFHPHILFLVDWSSTPPPPDCFLMGLENPWASDIPG
jgi:hypothetical protein